MDYVGPQVYSMPNVQPIHMAKPMMNEPAHIYHAVNVNAPVAAAPAVYHTPVPVGFTNTAMVLVLFILLVIILRSRLVLA